MPENETRLIKKTNPRTDSRINREKTRRRRTDFIIDTLIKLRVNSTIKDIISRIIIEINEFVTCLNSSKVKLKNKSRRDKISIYSVSHIENRTRNTTKTTP
jgi:hypothetical protein